jgi:hypothetical protein
MVYVVEQPVKATTVQDVILGAVGLTGVLVMLALLLGAILGGVLIGYKRLRARRGTDPDSDAIHISPYA